MVDSDRHGLFAFASNLRRIKGEISDTCIKCPHISIKQSKCENFIKDSTNLDTSVSCKQHVCPDERNRMVISSDRHSSDDFSMPTFDISNAPLAEDREMELILKADNIEVPKSIVPAEWGQW